MLSTALIIFDTAIQYCMKKSIFFLLLITTVRCFAQGRTEKITISDDLEILKLSANVYLPISYLNSPSFGRVPCNGLIYINNNEAVVMDTPPTEETSKQLLDWFYKSFPTVTIKAIIINHFHDDCLGGLAEFHKRGIPSYSSNLTPGLIKSDSVVRPQKTFAKELVLQIGNENVISRYPGEAHTKDNIVTWIKSEKILFGGCMVKAIDASKGNVADANEKEWPHTIQRVKKQFSNAKIVIPGHGNYGGPELLDYTIKLFSTVAVK